MSAAKLFKSEFSQNNLSNVYNKYISKTSAIGIDRLGRAQFEKHLDDNLEVAFRKIGAGNYIFSQYKEKLISKGANKYPRVISIPTFRDRIVLRVLCNIFNSVFESSISLKIPQVVISEIKNAISSGEYTHYAKLDIKEFYPSIKHDILRRRLKTKIRKMELVKLIESALRTPTVPYPDKSANSPKMGVPQGLSISNILAEIYLSPFDKQHLCNGDIRYFRYVDDILLLTKSDAGAMVEAIQSDLNKKYGLSVHEIAPGSSKTTCGQIDDRFTFLGYQFKSRTCLVKNESVKRIEDSLADIFTTYKYKVSGINSQLLDKFTRQAKLTTAGNILSWRLNLRITGCIFEGSRKGWVFYFSQIDETHLEQLWGLDRTVTNLIKRFDLPADFRAKSFVRTYFETRRRDPTKNRYIPNFDSTSVEEQRRILARYFGLAHLDNWSDEKVQNEFAIRIRRATKELELDIQEIS